MKKLVWDADGKNVLPGQITHITGYPVWVSSIEPGVLRVRHSENGMSAVAPAGTIGAHWVEVEDAVEVHPEDWPEDFNQENGMYQNKCSRCGLVFVGNKHRRVCKVCDQLPTLRWGVDGMIVRVGARVLTGGEVFDIDAATRTLQIKFGRGKPITVTAEYVGAHWEDAEETATAMPEVRSLHDQTLFDFFREFRYASVTTGGIGNGTYSRALAWIDNEARIRVAEALKGKS